MSLFFRMVKVIVAVDGSQYSIEACKGVYIGEVFSTGVFYAYLKKEKETHALVFNFPP